MRSVSGKFASPISNYVGEAEDKIADKIAAVIPPVPAQNKGKEDNPIVLFLNEYFGRFWWLWIVLLLILKIKNHEL